MSQDRVFGDKWGWDTLVGSVGLFWDYISVGAIC